MSVIVKVQVPLFTNGPAMALIYQEGRVEMIEQRITGNMLKALDGDPKGYFRAEIAGGRYWLKERVPDQDW